MKTIKPLPPAEVLRAKFDYDPESGILTWRESGRGHKGGVPAGHPTSNGYLRVKLGRTHYRVHRVVWAWWYGRDIDAGLVIDHIDRDRRNNRISNLRIATNADNLKNTDRSDIVELRRRNKPTSKMSGIEALPTSVIITYPDGATLTVPSIAEAGSVLGVRSATIKAAHSRGRFGLRRLRGVTVNVGERVWIDKNKNKKIKTKRKLSKATRRIR